MAQRAKAMVGLTRAGLDCPDPFSSLESRHGCHMIHSQRLTAPRRANWSIGPITADDLPSRPARGRECAAGRMREQRKHRALGSLRMLRTCALLGLLVAGFWWLENLRDHANEGRLLMLAAGGGDVEAMRQAMARGGACDERDESGSTALIHAALLGQREAIVFLAGHGADLDAKNIVGRTALMMAASQGNSDIVQLLLEKGALVDAEDEDGKTALRIAAGCGRAGAARVLLRNGASVNHGSDDGQSALMAAAGLGSVEVVHVLLEAGPEIDARDATGRTALMEAEAEGHADVVQVLRAVSRDGRADGRLGAAVFGEAGAVVCR